MYKRHLLRNWAQLTAVFDRIFYKTTCLVNADDQTDPCYHKIMGGKLIQNIFHLHDRYEPTDRRNIGIK